MPESAETLAFIRSSFRSVWSLELLCILKSEPQRSFSAPELVVRLRASDLVVRQSIDSLLAAGLILVDEGGLARYGPANQETDRLVGNAEKLYSRKPDAVRRLIVMAGDDPLSAFADAFRLRKD